MTTLLGSHGKPARRPTPADGRCPRCGSRRNRRMDATPLGAAPGSVVLCGACGHQFEGDGDDE